MSHWVWNESPTINTDYDIEFFSDTPKDTGTVEVPFAVLEVYTEVCGGGGGGGAANANVYFYPNDAASGGAGGAWGYKNWSVNQTVTFDYEVGEGGAGVKYSGGGCDGGGRGEDGGNSRITYNSGGSSVFMEAGGGEAGARSEQAFGGLITGADGGRKGTNTKRETSNTRDAKGGRGGGAGGLGAGSNTEGTFDVTWTVRQEVCYWLLDDGPNGGTYREQCDETFNTFTETVTANICGGAGGDGVGVGGALLNSGVDADTAPDGSYRVNGKPGGKYGGGGGGSSGGHCDNNYSDCGSREYINGWTAGGIDPYGFIGCLAITEIRISNTRRGGDGGDGADGFVYFAANYEQPEITVLELPTNENLDSSPTQELTLTYVTNYAHDIWLTDSSGREMFRITNLDEDGHPAKAPDGTTTFIADHLRSKVEDGISPACDIFTFHAKGPGGEVTQDIQGCIYNDDCIKDINILDQGPFDPNVSVEVSGIRVEDIDMPTVVQASQGLTFEIDGSGSFTNSDTVENGAVLTLKTESLPFCTDERGIPHYRKLYLDFGTGEGDCEVKRVTFTVITRRPETAEIFDFTDNSLAFPYPKIDTTDAEPTEYLQNNNGPVTINEVELSDPYGVQIRVKDVAKSKPYTSRITWDDVNSENTSDAQVRVNRSSQGLQDWKEPNVIGVNELPPITGPCIVEADQTYTPPPP